jgi:hypothetical protein
MEFEFLENLDIEVIEWFKLSPVERFEESQKLWENFILMGGNLDPEPDTQSPFNLFKTSS